MKLPRRRFLHLAAGAAALPALPRVRMGASLSVAAGAHRRRLSARRSKRHPRAPDRCNGFRSGSASHSSSTTGRALAAISAPRRSCNAPPDGYTLLLVAPSSAINATLYDKLNFNFIRDIAPVAGYQPQRHGHGCASISPGENSSRTDRLRQGQSRQDDHGVIRHRHALACGRAAVQDDERRRHASRALSWFGAHGH